jgi:outer membrane protein OmpA-like peptidoglycan-associated protein
MKNLRSFLIVAVLFCQSLFAQQGNLIFIGHNTFDNKPLPNCTITVMENTNTVETQSLTTASDFKFTLPLGKIYRMYFVNPKSQKMFLEIKADNIPENKKDYKITYELTIPFFPKDASTFDVTQFEKPFHRIVFDGKNKMVDDTIYMKAFLKDVYVKKKEAAHEAPKEATPTAKWTNLCGKFTYDNPDKTPVTGKKVNLMNSAGKITKTTTINKFGTFIFTGVNLNDADKIELDFNKEFTTQQVAIKLSNMQGENLGVVMESNNKSLWQNTKELRIIDKLIDPRFSYKIAAKLISESAGKFEFYSGKTVVLLNERNTVVHKTKTNVFGSFVFADIKPGATYLIGIEKSEAESKKVSLYTGQDEFIGHVDSVATTRFVRRFNADHNTLFNHLLIDESNLKMNVGGKIYNEDVSKPISDLKVLLLNDKMEVIDTTTSDAFGKFMFKYVPFNSQFVLSADEKSTILDAINNILVYNSEDELVKVVSMVKGRRFSYKPLNTEQSRMSEIFDEDPWLPLLSGKGGFANKYKDIIIENIFFESSKANLLPSAQLTLDKIALVMNSNDKMKIELSAHTDSNGDDASNQSLSQQRAKSAADYIISKGVAASRIVTKGYGETKILNRCKNGVFCSDDEHSINRRIEFKVLAN